MTVPKTMRSSRFLGEDRVEIEDRPVPEPGPGELLLRTSCCGLCGSEKRLFHNGAAFTPGHEMTGVVVAGGPGTTVQEGTRGILYIIRFCGTCGFCRAGETNRCVKMDGLLGWQTDGGYAEYFVAPENVFVPLPEDISDQEGVLLLDTIGTTMYGMKYADRCADSPARSRRIAVLGCGPLGLSSVLIARTMPFDVIAAHDPVAERLEKALAWQAEALDPQDESNRNTYSLVVEASGSHAGRDLALDLVENGGSVLLLGENDRPWPLPESPRWRRKDCAYVRSFYFPLRDIPSHAEVLRELRAEYNSLIDKVYPLDRLQDAFTEFCAGRSIKPMITPRG